MRRIISGRFPRPGTFLLQLLLWFQANWETRKWSSQRSLWGKSCTWAVGVPFEGRIYHIYSQLKKVINWASEWVLMELRCVVINGYKRFYTWLVGGKCQAELVMEEITNWIMMCSSCASMMTRVAVYRLSIIVETKPCTSLWTHWYWQRKLLKAINLFETKYVYGGFIFYFLFFYFTEGNNVSFSYAII